MNGPRTRPTYHSLVLVSLLALSACSEHIPVKPHSLLAEEASQQGHKVLTCEQENRRFVGYEQQNKVRLINLIKKRVSNPKANMTYRVGVADTLQFSGLDLTEFNTSETVTESGTITLPLVGTLSVSGLSLAEVKDLVTQRVSKFVRYPRVDVEVSEFGSQKIVVLGAVQRPGTYALKKGNNSLLEVLNDAGGVSANAGSFLTFMPVESTGIRSANDATSRAQLALRSISHSNANSYGVEVALTSVMGTSGELPLEIPIRGGDVIVVQEAGKVFVNGEVEKAGAVEIRSGMKSLTVLESAGGASDSAKLDEVELIRNVGGNVGKVRKIINLDKVANGTELDVLVRDGDIVRVPSDMRPSMLEDFYDACIRFLSLYSPY